MKFAKRVPKGIPEALQRTKGFSQAQKPLPGCHISNLPPKLETLEVGFFFFRGRAQRIFSVVFLNLVLGKNCTTSKMHSLRQSCITDKSAKMAKSWQGLNNCRYLFNCSCQVMVITGVATDQSII